MGLRTVVRMQTYDDETQLPVEEVDVYTVAEAVLFEQPQDEDGNVMIETLPKVLDRKTQLTTEKPTPEQVGAIPPGTTFNKAELSEVVEAILYPYHAAKVEMVSNRYYSDIDDLRAKVYKFKITKGTEEISSIIIKLAGDNTQLAESLEPIFDENDQLDLEVSIPASYDPTSRTVAMVVDITDHNGKLTKYNFSVLRLFHIRATKVAPDYVVPKQYGPKVLPTVSIASADTATGIELEIPVIFNSLKDEAILFAVPKIYTVDTIRDNNGFLITDSFTISQSSLAVGFKQASTSSRADTTGDGEDNTPTIIDAMPLAVYVSNVTTQKDFKVTLRIKDTITELGGN